MRIDAHQHFWSLRRGDYGWLTPALEPIYRDFGPADLAPLMAAGGIDRTILVQAAPTEAETHFLLDIAAAHPMIAGVVGWTDFAAPDALARIRHLAGNPLVVGLRPMVQDIPDENWLVQDTLAPAFAAMAAEGLVFDALVLPRHLPRLLAVVDRHPDLSVVIDHAAKPALQAGVSPEWLADMAALAGKPNVFCKVSGLMTEAPRNCTAETFRPVLDHLLTHFGPERLIWGSDWPVLNLAADYGRWLMLAEELLVDLSEQSRAAVFGGNAARVYLSQVRRRRHAERV